MTDGDALLAALLAEGPLTVPERSAFLLRRYVEYKHHLVHDEGAGPRNEAERLRYSRLREVANVAALEDLQALLGRRGELAARVELELYSQERGEAPLEPARGSA